MTSPLKGFNSVFEATLNNDIQDGLIEYFDWALLEKGNYFNVTKGELAPNGQDYSRLRLSSNDNFTKGKVWEGFRKNWVWQSGITYSPTPVVGSDHSKPGISGIYINDQFYSTSTTGTYSYNVDYYNGRIIFNNAIPTGSKVQAEYSYKWINVVYPHVIPWLREVQVNTIQPDSNFLTQDKTKFNLPPEGRLQLPAIAIELVPTRTFKGFQLGGGQWVNTDVIFHCIAEDEPTRNKLIDIVSLQNDKNIYLFDSNKLNTYNKFPIDYRGTPVSGALRYPDIIDQYNGGLLRLKNTTVDQMVTINSDIYGGIVRMTTEVIQLNI